MVLSRKINKPPQFRGYVIKRSRATFRFDRIVYDQPVMNPVIMNSELLSFLLRFEWSRIYGLYSAL